MKHPPRDQQEKGHPRRPSKKLRRDHAFTTILLVTAMATAAVDASTSSTASSSLSSPSSSLSKSVRPPPPPPPLPTTTLSSKTTSSAAQAVASNTNPSSERDPILIPPPPPPRPPTTSKKEGNRSLKPPPSSSSLEDLRRRVRESAGHESVLDCDHETNLDATTMSPSPPKSSIQKSASLTSASKTVVPPKDTTGARLPPPPPPLPPRQRAPTLSTSSFRELVREETKEEGGITESTKPLVVKDGVKDVLADSSVEEVSSSFKSNGLVEEEVAPKVTPLETKPEKDEDKQQQDIAQQVDVSSSPPSLCTNQEASHEVLSSQSRVQQKQQVTGDENPFERLKLKAEAPSHRVIPPPPKLQDKLADHHNEVDVQHSERNLHNMALPPMAQDAVGTPATFGRIPYPPRNPRMQNVQYAGHERLGKPREPGAPHGSNRSISNKSNPVSHTSRTQKQYQYVAGAAGRSALPPPGHDRVLAQQTYGYPNQQQQHQQQKQRPHQGTPSRRSTTTASSTSLQGLWSRVEKRLDDLADLEDAITGRASNLVSTAVPKKWRRDSTMPHTTSPNGNRQQQRPRPSGPKQTRGSTSQPPLSTPHTRWQQQEKLQREAAANKAKTSASSSSQPSVSVHPYTLLDSAKKKFGTTSKTNSGISSAKKVEWDGILSGNARKLMPANGGASAPNGYQQSWQNYQVQNGDGPAWSSQSPPKQRQESQMMEPNNSNPKQQQQQQGTDLNTTPVHQRQDSPQYGPRSPSAPQAHMQGQGAWQQQDKYGNPQVVAAADATSGKSRSAFSEQAQKASIPTRVPTRPSSYDDDDDDKKSIIFRAIGAIPVPSVGKLLNFRRKKVYNNYASLDAWDATDDEKKSGRIFFGIFGSKKGDTSSSSTSAGDKKQRGRGHLPQPVQHLLERSDKGRTVSLLSSTDKKRIRSLGKSRAAFDAIAVALFILGVRELNGLESVPLPTSLYEFGANTIPNLLICILTSGDTWAPIALAAAVLAVWTNSLVFDGQVERVSTDVARIVQAEASYGRLFLRLLASTPTDISLPSKIFKATGLQVAALADLSRLRSYVTYAITAILIMTVDFIRPLVLAIVTSIMQLVTLSEWRTWPIAFDKLLAEAKAIFSVVGNEVRALIGGELQGAGHHPMQVAFKVSILASLVAAAYIPALEKRRKLAPNDDNEEENTEEIARRMSEQISDMGACSACRLGVLSKNGEIESTIERWRLVQEESSNQVSEVSIRSLFRRLGYYIASWSTLAAPVFIFGFLLNVPMSGWTSATVSHWEAMFEVSLLLLITNGLAWKATARAVESSILLPEVQGFLKSLAQASEEAAPQQVAPQPLRTGANPTAGLLVKNFWAAHVVKRAWAVRGANLQCRNGEVVVLLGDDGVGKTRLLTAIAESIMSPPKQALTTQIQRGNVSVGGIDVTKWDRNELKKRVGISLCDIRSLAKTADLWSGMSLEEILEPGDAQRIADPTHTSGARERSCMLQALKITGLYWSLLPRLPSKLSTILTSSEEDLAPSPLRPRYFVLSPSEWSKLLLTKVLAQAMYDSENSMGTTGKSENCLVGSLFLLDDATTLLSEIEESKLLRDLRQTGASTVLSSNKWATGRLADRIAVVKDGVIVENGTHNELLSRGPQHSYYAAKWQAMTSG